MPLNKKRFARQKVNRRILAIHSAIADKLIVEPALIDNAKACLQRRREQQLISYGAFIVWQDLLPLLNSNPALFKQELLSPDTRMEQLRRETIFVDILTEEERQAALDSVTSSA